MRPARSFRRLRNAGPISALRRSSGNALRHGLRRVTNTSGGADIEALARLLVGANEDEETLELARGAVLAHLDLLRIREVKRDLMERVYQLGMVDPPPRIRFRSADIRYLLSQPLDRPLRWPRRVNPSGAMPSGRDERAAEAMRRALPDLRKLDRYERRAFNAKRQALGRLAELVKFSYREVLNDDLPRKSSS